MSLAQQVNQAINTAKAALGDLVVAGTLREVTGRTYDTGTGLYTDTVVDHPVEVAPDKFSYTDEQSGQFEQTDIKMILFNPNNDLFPTTKHQLILSTGTFNILKSDPSYAGSFIPAWTLVLRK